MDPVKEPWKGPPEPRLTARFENPGAFSDPHLEQLSLTELYRGDGKTFQASPVTEDRTLNPKPETPKP